LNGMVQRKPDGSFPHCIISSKLENDIAHLPLICAL
jgi:hypothetical protein